MLSYKDRMYQETTDATLEDFKCVGEKAPMEIRAGVNKDPHGRLPRKVSFVRSILGEENNMAWLCV